MCGDGRRLNVRWRGVLGISRVLDVGVYTWSFWNLGMRSITWKGNRFVPKVSTWEARPAKAEKGRARTDTNPSGSTMQITILTERKLA